MVTYGELFQLIDIVIQIVTLVIVLTKRTFVKGDFTIKMKSPPLN